MKLRAWVLWTTVFTFALILLGAYVVKTYAGQSCPDWPQCNGKFVPPFESVKDANGNDVYTSQQILSEYFHRVLAMITGFLVVAVNVVAFRRYREHAGLTTLSVTLAGLFFAQALIGKFTVDMGNVPWTVVLHQGLAMAIFGVLAALLVLSWRQDDYPRPEEKAAEAKPDAAEAAAPRSTLQTMADYVALLKPRVLMLLLISAVTTMLIASGRDPDGSLHLAPWTVIATVLGGAMASGSGSAFNQWWERDLDAMMARTATRPVAAGRLPGPHVLAFSASLAVGSFTVLAVFVNLLAASLALAGCLFYVLVYTMWLKRSRPSNIVIGGAAGSFPVLVGWAAVTGEVTLPALVLGFIIFLWTPPHFWAFALLYKNDYARAGIPMLPVVRGDGETRQQILLYSLALLGCTTSLWFFDVLSIGYLFVSSALGLLFVLLAFELWRVADPRAAQRVFRFSILYLGLLFLYMAVDRIWIVRIL